MASYFIGRENAQDLTPARLKELVEAFKTLHCSPDGGEGFYPQVKIIIRGEWGNNGGDGLFLKYNGGAEIVRIGRKYVTVCWANQWYDNEYAQVELCPAADEGFSQIVLMNVSQGGYNG